MRRGVGNMPLTDARNYSYVEAQKRLDEAIKPIQNQQLNALNVDAHEVEYYCTHSTTQVCTCRSTEIVPERAQQLAGTDISPETMGGIATETGLEFDWNRPLFGEHNAGNDSLDEDSEIEFDDDDGDAPSYTENPTVESLFGSTVDCGICYRTGFVPPFAKYGHENNVLSTHVLEDVDGFTMDATKTPHELVRVVKDGYCEYEVSVPKFFDEVRFSVRLNTKVLEEELIYVASGKPLTFDYLKSRAGKKILVRVQAERFTHAIIDFKVGNEIKANIAQISKSQDWSQFEAIGTLGVVLPVTIAQPQAGDIIVARNINLVLKLTDEQFLRDAKNSNLDWSVTTRIIQPHETLKKISKNRKLF